MWEAKEGVKITKEAPPKLEDEEEDEDEEEGDRDKGEDAREGGVPRRAHARGAQGAHGRRPPAAGRRRTTLEVQFLVDEAGGLEITAGEADGGEKVRHAG
ncbi:hypothetical protein PsYK624_055110 [Phanerochaete sordida]|uniref:Uncharacterized protein n=1 Tax=Phanerochaete sordida TaxID=48140 RepID=A0A9P3LBP2_9APHY|nr:hypothetical protein PsYK624_055110 [Phanerochaete sordida]